ncbi:unnamed protein product [Prorocentrum cordatum]|uniref:Uncharacterized protein n=1 Tax=Prorocentrum cordatum TaxID=2364126 RepID=A0ABN9UB83_9DINO|nr:unnamed protein product [Polarella glacialis]
MARRDAGLRGGDRAHDVPLRLRGHRRGLRAGGQSAGAHGRQLWCVALVLLPLAGRDVSHDRVAAVFSGRGLVSLSGARAQDDRAALAAYFPNRHVRRRRARRIGRQVAGCLGTKRGGGCSRPGATD